jgi:hypothetical protein
MSAANILYEARPRVRIYSSRNYLTLSLTDVLLENSCNVEVISSDISDWVKQNDYLKISQTPDANERPDYVIAIFLEEKDWNTGRDLVNNTQKDSVKTIYVFPNKQSVSFEHKIAKLKASLFQSNPDNIIVYLGDHLGPRMMFNSTAFSQLMQSILLSNHAKVLSNQDYFPVYTPEAAQEIVNLLLSFGPPTNEVTIYSEKLSAEELLGRLSKAVRSKEFIAEISKDNVIQKELNQIITKKDFEGSIKEVFSWFTQNPIFVEKQNLPKKSEPKPNKVKPAIHKLRIENKRHNRLPVFAYLASFVLLLPFVFLLLSALTLQLGAKNLKSYQLGSALKYLKTSAVFSSGASQVLGVYSKTPIIGTSFLDVKESSSTVYRLDMIGINAISVARTANNLLIKIFGDEVYSPEEYSNEIVVGLDGLYRDLAFVDSEISMGKGVFGKLIKKYVGEFELADLRANILVAKTFAERAPLLLGSAKPTSYLIIFQNNMELRPTGGFIGSFALASFDGGRLGNLDVQDVYSADGQLKGHVDPPVPIKKYLGEGGWYLRDANWDPDFPSAAGRIEWFLNKEIDKSVDGVVAVDLEVAKTLLRITGPIELQDFNEQIDAENIYEKTQAEVQSEFFPGSIKKASFLSALSKSLLASGIELLKSSRVFPVQETAKLLNGRHLQLFFHDVQLQKAVSKLGFSGEVLIPFCSGNCYADWLALVEANLGVNKANYYLKRSAELGVSLFDGKIERTLAVNYENTANPISGPNGIYKNYLRVLLPQNINISGAFLKSGESTENIIYDERDISGMKEIGILLEILPGQTKSLILSWGSAGNLNFSESGEYRVYWRKQAGTGEDPISVSILPPGNLTSSVWPELPLTKEGGYVYNTTLARDLFSRVSW